MKITRAVAALGIVSFLSCSDSTSPPVPTTIALVSGSSQTATVRQAVSLPPSVKVTDAQGRPVGGVSVTFAVTTGGGTVTGAAQTTGADGVATVGSWELGTVVGQNTLAATSGTLTGSPVSFTATAVAGPVATVTAAAGMNQTATVGTTVSSAPSVTVSDAYGNAVSGTTVTFAVASGGGTITGATQASNSAGAATIGGWTLGTIAGTNSLTATVAGLAAATFTATALAGPATTIALNAGNGQSATVAANVAIAPTVKVSDQYGNAVSGTALTFSVQSGGGTVTGGATMSNATGMATVGSWTLGNTAGANVLHATATALSGSPVIFTATGNPGPAAAIAVNDGDNQTTTPGSAVGTAPSVKVTDMHGNAVSGTAVTFAVASGGGSVSGGSQTTSASGIARVGSWTLGSTAGANTLTATSTGLAGSPVTFSATAAQSSCPQGSIAVGQSKTGSLASGDCTFSDGSYVDLYELSLSSSTALKIDLTSASFDTYLIVGQSGTVVTSDDDGGTGTNSQASVTLSAGTYTIYVTSYGPGEIGSYTLSVAQGDVCYYAGTLTVGTPATGTLSTSDCTLSDGRYADPWSFTLSATTSVRVNVGATGFDTYAYLTTADGTILDEDDDSGTGSNSLIETTLAAGTYVIWATSYFAGKTGSYSISAETAGAACSTAVQLTLGTPVNGALASSDCTFSDGAYTDPYTFTLASQTSVTMSMASDAFDTYIVLASSSGTAIDSDDDGGTGTNSRLVRTLDAGTYTLWARSYSAGMTGSYQVAVTAGSSACSTSTAITVGQTVSGSLATTDCQLGDGSFMDRWQLTLSSATAVTVDMKSSAFDTYLFLTNSSGETIALDDDSGDGTDSRIEISLDAGTYIIGANSYSAGLTGAYTLAVAGTTSGGSLNLRIDRLYLTQAVQTLSGTVPLMAGRTALLRVFVRANQANTAQPAVRVRIYNASNSLVATQTIAATGSSVTTTLAEGSLGSTWNYLVPASYLTVGMKVLADVDPTNAITESNETDNSYPLSGTAATIDVRTMPTFNITMVPVTQSVNGKTGNVTSANVTGILSMTRALWPLVDANVIVRATYTTTLPALQNTDQNGSWSALLSELDALRVAEASSRYYHGIVAVTYTSGIAGLGYVGRATAMSWDYAGSVGEVVTHELGHNFGRRHAPCGNPGGPDANYPYAGGATGVYGYDVRSGILRAPTLPDIMAYCDDPWVSDYTYQGALDFLKDGAGYVASAGGVTEGVLLWGRIDGSRVVLEPAVDVVARPTSLPGTGNYRLQGFSAAGVKILDFAFEPSEVSAEIPTASRQFAFIVPKSRLGSTPLASLRLSGPEGSAEMKSLTPPNASIVSAPTTATRLSTNSVEVRWDAQSYRLAVVRSTTTGEILSFARTGVVSVSTNDASLDITLSDGVRSVTTRVEAR